MYFFFYLYIPFILSHLYVSLSPLVPFILSICYSLPICMHHRSLTIFFSYILCVYVFFLSFVFLKEIYIVLLLSLSSIVAWGVYLFIVFGSM